MITHGLSKHELYRTWQKMINRCYKLDDKDYPRYGGRGITVCTEWLGVPTQFISDMHPRPSKTHTLDRSDNNGNYCKGNCHWATYQEQSRNTRTARKLEYRGVTYNLKELANNFGMSHQALRYRLGIGLSLEKALSEPLFKTNRFNRGEKNASSTEQTVN